MIFLEKAVWSLIRRTISLIYSIKIIQLVRLCSANVKQMAVILKRWKKLNGSRLMLLTPGYQSPTCKMSVESVQCFCLIEWQADILPNRHLNYFRIQQVETKTLKFFCSWLSVYPLFLFLRTGTVKEMKMVVAINKYVSKKCVSVKWNYNPNSLVFWLYSLKALLNINSTYMLFELPSLDSWNVQYCCYRCSVFVVEDHPPSVECPSWLWKVLRCTPSGSAFRADREVVF